MVLDLFAATPTISTRQRFGERGPQMLTRFSDIGERLRGCGVQVIFVYPKGAWHAALDSVSLPSMRHQPVPSLFVDDDGHFFRTVPAAKSLRTIYLDQELRRVDAVALGLQGEAWDSELRAFLARVISRCVH